MDSYRNLIKHLIWMVPILIIVIGLCLHLSSSTSPEEIESLPGLTQGLSFRQYSGYLNGGQDIYLHYWFVESQANPSTDPVVLWLNGGPGESSLLGLFTENGPFRVSSDGKTVTLDPNSWNSLANMLYLESPVGVGFSYWSKNETFMNNDDKTARMNYLALSDFFRKFPMFKKNPFYIMGESYGGIYSPMLALELIKYDRSINLKGIGIGNGVLDNDLKEDYGVRFAYEHGLIDTDRWNNLTKQYCSCTTNGQVCDYGPEFEESVNNMVADGINPYNIYDDMCSIIKYNETGSIMHYLNVFEDCLPMGAKAYLNQPDVRKALHIPDHVKIWKPCFCNIMRWGGYKKQYTSMKSQIKEIIDSKVLDNFLVYYGDLDVICAFLGQLKFVDDLGYKVINESKPWKVNGRVAGYVKRYEGITFTTVSGAGHSVPVDKPLAALSVLKELIGHSKLG